MKAYGKLGALCLALCLCLTGLMFHAQAAEAVASGSCGENLTWVLDGDGTLTISGTGDMENYGDLEVDGESVYVPAPWEDLRGSIQSAVIQEGVTSIGSSAFSYCTNLTGVTIPDSVKRIGESAFAECPMLWWAELPEGLTFLGRNAFMGCGSLKTMVLPEGLPSIENGTFVFCSGLERITIPGSVTKIDSAAFMECGSLKTIVFTGETPPEIQFDAIYTGEGPIAATVYYHPGNEAWDGIKAAGYASAWTWVPLSGSCGDNLTWVLDGDGTLTISGTGPMDGYGYASSHKAEQAPWYGLPITVWEVVVEEGVTTLGDNAFRDCGGLKKVTIPEGVTAIGETAFYGCRSLERVHIPASVTAIGDCAFIYCSSLEEVTGMKGITRLQKSSYWQMTIDGGIFQYTGLGQVNLPEGLTEIGDRTFGYCGALRSVTVPKTVTLIENDAFCWAGNGEQTQQTQCDLTFQGDAPQIQEGAFQDAQLRVYYPAGNASYDGVIGSSYGAAAIAWIPYETASDAVWTPGDAQCPFIRALIDLIHFRHVYMDGVPVAPEHYTATQGSTVITFHEDYLQSLSEGEHTVRLEFTDSDAVATLTVQPKQANRFDIPGVSMSLGNSLGVYFWVPAVHVSDGDYAVIVKEYANRDAVSVTVPKSEWMINEDYYLIAFDGIAAKEMTDSVTCTIYHAGGEQTSNPKAASIQAYAHNQLANTSDAALKRVLVDMLNYGAQAQIQFNYHMSDLATGKLTDDQKALATASLNMDGLGHTVSKGTGWAAGSLTLKSNIVMNIIFDNTVVTRDMRAKVSYTDYKGKAISYDIAGADFQDYGDGAHIMVNIDTLVVSDLVTVVSVDIYDGDTCISENQYNMAQYCQSTAAQPISVALAKYCRSACDYLA